MDDWQVGDLALCVRNGFKRGFGISEVAPAGWQITVGSILTVSGVFAANDPAYRARGIVFLEFQDVPAARQYDCRGFRKIRPLTDEERDSFLADLDAPVSPAVPSTVARPVTAQRGTGHISPLSVLPSTLPDPSADDTPRHADGSGLSDLFAAHVAAQ